MLVYIYDIKFKTKKDFNKTKRVFYYNLQKLGLGSANWITKSTIVVPDSMERTCDLFFRNFRKRTKNLVVYKAFAHNIEEIE